MIYLVRDYNSDVVLTLKEKQLLTNPNYLFRFIHRSLNTEVKFVLLNNTDTSAYKDRFNQFSITTNAYFYNAEAGEWEYYIYEQASPTNLNPAGLNLLETGIMRLSDNSTFSFTTYQTSNTFITR